MANKQNQDEQTVVVDAEQKLRVIGKDLKSIAKLNPKLEPKQHIKSQLLLTLQCMQIQSNLKVIFANNQIRNK